MFPRRSRQPPASRPRRGLRAVPVLVVVGVAAAAVASAHGGFTGTVRNAANGSGTGSLQLAAAAGGSGECATSTTSPAASCTGTVVSDQLGSGSQSLATTVSEPGSLTATATTLTQGACGPIPLANSASSADPMLIRGGVTTAAGSPFPDGAGLSLDGSSGYAANALSSVTAPQNFTEVIWFKTAGKAGGTLLGYSDTPSLAPSSSDRLLWLDNAGKLVFGVHPNTAKTVTSPAAYNDGKWHLAAASISSAGQVLYVDGKNVASAKPVTSAQSFTGYWHVGWENENQGWPDPPTDLYFSGSLTNAAIFPVLTPPQITTLSKVTTQATWNADIAGGNGVSAATSAWQLGDPPTAVYTGTPSWLTPAPCSLVDATIGTSGTAAVCAAPSSSSPCTAPTSGVTLASLVNTPVTITPPTPAQTTTLTVTTARDPTNTTAHYPDLAGLHLNLGETLTSTAGGFTATLSWPTTQNIVL